MAIEVSLCMIVKNEEHNLDNCLKSVADLMDEIIIVDTGSTDRTVEIASKYTDKIYYFEWIYDFSAARNFSFSKATKEYVMWLDADDIMAEADRIKFKKLKRTLNRKYTTIFMFYITNIDEDGNPILVTRRERMVKRSKNYKWQGVIHESITIGGYMLVSDVYITHTDMSFAPSLDRNLEILERVIHTDKETLRDVYYYGTTLNSLGRYDEALVELNRFIELNTGTDFSGLDAYIAAHNIYLMRNDYERAYLVLSDNSERFADKSEFFCCLGDFSKNVFDDNALACSYYEKALKCTGKDYKSITFSQRFEEYYYYIPYYRMGLCLIKLSKFKEAKKAFLKAATYRADDSELEKFLEKVERLIELSSKQAT